MPPHSRRIYLAGLLLFAVCAGLRVGLLDRHSLWADEFFSLAMATGHSLEQPVDRTDPGRGDFREETGPVTPRTYSRYLEHEMPPAGLRRVVRAVFLSDTNPPLYYSLLYGWTRVLGTGDTALRLFSLLLSLGCFPLAWALGKRVGGASCAFSTCLLFTVSPVSVYYSTEGRMYSLLFLLSLLTIWLTLDLQDRGLRRIRLALWIVVSAGGLLTHYFFIFVWLAAILWLQVRPGRSRRPVSLVSAIFAVVLVLPWYIHVPESLAIRAETHHWLMSKPDGYRPIVTALKLPWKFLSVDGPAWGFVHPFWHWMNRIVFLVLALAVARRVRHLFSAGRGLLWLWAAASCAGLSAFDLFLGSAVASVPRYALAGMPAAFLLVGVALESFRSRTRVVFLAAIALVSLAGVLRFYEGEGRHGYAYDEVARAVGRDPHPGDLVLAHSVHSGVAGIARHLERECPGAVFAPCATGQGLACPDRIETLFAGCPRVILIEIHAYESEVPEQSWLEKNGTLERVEQAGGATVLYFLPGETMAMGSGTQ